MDFERYLGGEVDSALVSDGDELLLGGGGVGHVVFDFSADGGVEGTAETSIGGDSDEDLLLGSLGALQEECTVRATSWLLELTASMDWAPIPKARAGPIFLEDLANLAEEIIFIVLVIFSMFRMDLSRIPSSFSLPEEFRV